VRKRWFDPKYDQLSLWSQPLKTLSSIPGVQLKVEWVDTVADLNHPCIAQWLDQHGQLISHLTIRVHVSDARLKLRDFVEAAAQCRSIELTLLHSESEVVDLADLIPIAGCLCRFSCSGFGSLIGTSAFNSMSRLVALRFVYEDFGSEEPWGMLANLRALQQLELSYFNARGDPSSLSALTGLTLLDLNSLDLPADADFSFSSLQPLSTLQQLEVLGLRNRACAATSLQGLAGLSKLKKLELGCDGMLLSLEGISPGVVELQLMDGSYLTTLAGIEGCTRLEKMWLSDCGVTSLQPLTGLSSMKELCLRVCCLTSLESLYSMRLRSLTLECCASLTDLSGMEHLSALKSLTVMWCYGVTSLQPLSQLGPGLQELEVIGCSKVREEVLELPHVQPTADVDVEDSNVREVVLAGGVRRGVRPMTETGKARIGV
jgi:Leucine-rich repeat (LRR) protein